VSYNFPKLDILHSVCVCVFHVIVTLSGHCTSVQNYKGKGTIVNHRNLLSYVFRLNKLLYEDFCDGRYST
jgi:hypothetical protein